MGKGPKKPSVVANHHCQFDWIQAHLGNGEGQLLVCRNFREGQLTGEDNPEGGWPPAVDGGPQAGNVD